MPLRENITGLQAANFASMHDHRHFSVGGNDLARSVIRLVTEASSTDYGTRARQAPMVTFSETPGVARSAVRLGGSTRSVLRELGYDEAEVDDLAARGVIGI